MLEFLPVAVVFVLGFVGYLGKIGIAGALARRKAKIVKTAKIAASKEIVASKEITDRLEVKNKIISDNLASAVVYANDYRISSRRYPSIIKDLHPALPVEENIFQATKEDLEWYAKALRERHKYKYNGGCRYTGKRFFIFKPEDGVTHTIRILPPFVAAQTPNAPRYQSKLFAVAQQHYIDNGDVLQCGKKREGRVWVGNCPICERYEFLMNKSSPAATPKEALKFKPTERFYYNVIIIGEGESLPRIWSVSRFTHERIEREIVKSGDDISNLMTGRSIKVTRHTRKQPAVEFDKEPSMMSRENIQNWMVRLWNLEEHVRSQAKSEEELEAAANGLSDLRRCAYCKKLHTSYFTGLSWCSASCHSNQSTVGFCQSGSLRLGNWVYWETQSGTISVRPSVIYRDEQRKILDNGCEQWVMLKHKQNKGWNSFWVPAIKCKLLSLCLPTNTIDVDDYHIKNMYEDFCREVSYTAQNRS